jgi:PAS domain S-box-containing protein
LREFSSILFNNVILEKKLSESEKSRRESEERFFKLFHASSNLMTITTIKDGRMIDLNEASAGLVGYKREELIGTVEAERDLWTNPKQRNIVIRKLQEDGRIHDFEVRLRTKTGDIRTVLFSADPITVNDEACSLSVFVDITAREKMAMALREGCGSFRKEIRLFIFNDLA